MIDINNAKLNLSVNGFLHIDIDVKLDLFEEINKLKKKKNAMILAHYYQDSDIQDIADYIGDSLGLAQMAKKRMLILLFLLVFTLWQKQQKF